MTDTKNIGEKKNRKRITTTVLIYAASLLVGLIMGIGLSNIEAGTLTLPDTLLIFIVGLLTIFLYSLTWFWYKSMDEFERKIFNESGNLALHAGFITLPWFILHELKLAPSLDAIWLLVFMTFVFFITYYGRKLLNR